MLIYHQIYSSRGLARPFRCRIWANICGAAIVRQKILPPAHPGPHMAARLPDMDSLLQNWTSLQSYAMMRRISSLYAPLTDMYNGERHDMEKMETDKLQRYLRTRFGNQNITLKSRNETSDDSVEFLIDDETLGIVYRDEEDGDVCYHVQLTVLSEDLDG